MGTPTAATWPEGLQLAQLVGCCGCGAMLGCGLWRSGAFWRMRGSCAWLWHYQLVLPAWLHSTPLLAFPTLLTTTRYLPLLLQMSFRFPQLPAQPLGKLVATAGPEAIELMTALCHWDPKVTADLSTDMSAVTARMLVWGGQGASWWPL